MSPSNEERAPVRALAPDPIDFDPDDLVFRDLELLDFESSAAEPEAVWFARSPPPPPPSSPPRAIVSSRPPPPDPIGDDLADAWFR